MADAVDPGRRKSSFEALERVKTDERRRRYQATTPGERVEAALRLGGLAGELRLGLRARGG